MQRVILTGEGYSSSQLEQLRCLNLDVTVRSTVTHRELDELLPVLDGYVLGGDERLGESQLRRAKRLRVIAFAGTGYEEFVDPTAASALGIAVVCTPGVNSGAVAEHAVGLILGVGRQLFAQNEAVKRSNARLAVSSEVADMTIGIVGMGAIGSRVARLLTKGFEASVVYASRSRKPELERELGMRRHELASLLPLVDGLVLALPTTSETIGLLGRQALALAKPGLFLVNVAGAPLVDPSALYEALQAGTVSSAAFDGYWKEPVPQPIDDPYGFLSLPDSCFVVTPHTAARTPSTWTRMLSAAVDNLIAVMSLGGRA